MTTALAPEHRRDWTRLTDFASRCASVAWRTLLESLDDRILSVAGGVTFFILLALFPAIASIVSLYGLFGDRTSIAHLVNSASQLLPGGAITVLDAELHRLAAQKVEKLDASFFLALVIAIWSASGGIKALGEGLNIAYEVREMRSFLKLTVHALLATAASVVCAAGIIDVATLAPAAMQRFVFGREVTVVLGFLRWPAIYVLCVFVLDILYKIGPDRRRARWQWVSWGSAIASLLWILGTVLFGWYVRNYGSYDRVYGDLGAVVGFLTWIWLSLVIMLAGAELNCEIERPQAKAPVD